MKKYVVVKDLCLWFREMKLLNVACRIHVRIRFKGYCSHEAADKTLASFIVKL